ncbi:hypothetical protein NM688_g6442 [Phlebia brevispora]|uniref:Uncharacterized protein n=1 Tax=Phlebia brevispora TaxID=194682 RepID=A0ACC1SFZ4_9APHY|nr:hypothetical protein NM688_g6442 [Phlebia brevispora]
MDQAAQQKKDVSYAAVAATAWIVWDTLTNIDVEVEYIWKLPNAPWMKIAYLFIRYVTILHAGAVLTLDVGAVRFPGTACRIWLAEEGIYMEVLALAVEVLLVLRLYVLFNQNKVVLWAMSTAFVAEIACMAAAIGKTVPAATFNENCQILWTPSFFMVYWLSSLIFETFLFGLTLVAFVRHVKDIHRKHSILFVFFRDGTWAFALIFVCMLLNTLMYKLNANPLAGMGYYWDLSVMSFAGAHILLNIRRLGVPDGPSGVGTTLPTMQFELSDIPTAVDTAHFSSTATV